MPKYEIKDEELHARVLDYLKSEENVEGEEVTLSTPGAAKVPRKCASGSGLMTGGGKFAPGYDAKLKSALYHIARGKPEGIPDELKEFGPEYRPINEWTPELAVERIQFHGWPLPVPPKPKKEKAVKADTEEANGDTPTETGQTKASRRRASKAAKADTTDQDVAQAEADAEASV